ncbi:endonuclease 8-like 1 isoform X2 [Echeneis naucrates]|uniref:endonuclease 8-like 1 isoform X2 n=1 Tax=Echeneis naucrates TaxID=173247 RepID=UPI0011135BFB|nr:endonuclease 8-like 1 isoform X2 [Echeneis naucrates]
MPEGPELHLASLYVNKMCKGVVFTGPVRKSEVSKNPDVPFTSEAYFITAVSRGKEVKLTLTPIKTDEPKVRVKAGQTEKPMDVVFRFGMSGYFRLTKEDELPKHAHLRFYTKETPCKVLSFVDARRFGSWEPNGTWQPARGPCIMFEYKSFRENVVSHLSDSAFDRPICEVLLNQKYFNGIGNYLRAEILFRTVLKGLESEDPSECAKPVKNEIADTKMPVCSKKEKVKAEVGDLLRLCHTVPLEVVNLGGKGYDPEKSDYSVFEAWLQCYYVDGMKSMRDHNGRTIWFEGDPGALAPKNSKSPKAKKRAKKEDDHDYTEKKKLVRNASKDSTKRAVKQEASAKTRKKQKDVHGKRARSKKRHTDKSQEVNTPSHLEKGTTARRRRSSVEPAGGSQRRSSRLTRQNNQ